MGKLSLVIAIIGLTPLAACSSKTDANAKNFSEAISSHMAKDDALCLSARKWPADIPETALLAPSKPVGSAVSELEALKKLGLVDSSVMQANAEGTRNAARRVVRYTPTETAAPYFRQHEMKEFTVNGMQPVKGGKFCVAKVAVDKVVKWDAPMKLGEYEEVKVNYTYKISGLADWAKRPEFAAAYPKVVSFIESAGKTELTETLKKTNEGWEVISKR